MASAHYRLSPPGVWSPSCFSVLMSRGWWSGSLSGLLLPWWCSLWAEVEASGLAGGRDALVKLVIADYMFLLQGQTSDGQPVSGRTQSWKWCLHLSKSLWISRTRKLKLTVTENCFAAASTNKFCFPLITSHAVMSRAGPMLDFWGWC